MNISTMKIFAIMFIIAFLFGCQKQDDDFFAYNSTTSTRIVSGSEGTSMEGKAEVQSQSKGNYRVDAYSYPDGQNLGKVTYEDGRMVRHTFNEEAEREEAGYEYLNEWSTQGPY